jgi:hypothetical protein
MRLAIQDHQLRSFKMYTLHEALGRERTLDARRAAEHYRVTRRLGPLAAAAGADGALGAQTPRPRRRRIHRVDSASLRELTLNVRPERQPPRPADALISPEVFFT